MTNKQFMYIIKTFQENDYVHPLTCVCGAGSLDSYEKEDRVVLYCRDCGYEQEIDDQLRAIIMEMYMHNPFNPGLMKG